MVYIDLFGYASKEAQEEARRYVAEQSRIAEQQRNEANENIGKHNQRRAERIASGEWMSDEEARIKEREAKLTDEPSDAASSQPEELSIREQYLRDFRNRELEAVEKAAEYGDTMADTACGFTAACRAYETATGNRAASTTGEKLSPSERALILLPVKPKVKPPKKLPFGFRNAGDFSQFGKTLNTGLSDAGFGSTKALLQGSAVTGKSYRTGKAFDAGRVSDFDIALAGPDILARAKQLGIELRSKGTRTGPLSAAEVKRLGLGDVQVALSKQAGRPVNFMIYGDAGAAAARAPSIGF